MNEQRPKPVPVADELSAPFWNGARERRLVIQRCADCNYYNHPPRPFCDACLSQRLEFQAVSGRGSIYSYTVMHQRDVAGFEHEAPFINIVVELEEQPLLLMVANLPSSERERVRVGALVEVVFEERGEGLIIPQFRIV
ncbi:MAG TPA: OB-fold domain-containing protein [Candidatus Binataceae bacterium]|nr:OB-fold domain-containing protein [Candidatus Binataceae bacterium]